MLTEGQPGCKHLDSFSVFWWILSHSHRICGHSCLNFSPTCEDKNTSCREQTVFLHLYRNQSKTRPLQSVSRRGDEVVNLWRALPAQSARGRQLAHARGSDQLRWAANPVFDIWMCHGCTLIWISWTGANITIDPYMYFSRYSVHCTRTIPSNGECSHTTPQQPSAPMTNWHGQTIFSGIFVLSRTNISKIQLTSGTSFIAITMPSFLCIPAY